MYNYSRTAELAQVSMLQLNEYETDPYFLQLFQSNTTICLINHLNMRGLHSAPKVVFSMKILLTPEYSLKHALFKRSL